MVRLIADFACGSSFCHTCIEDVLLEVVVVDLHLREFFLYFFILEEDLLEGPEPDAKGWSSLSDFGVE